MKLPLYFDEEDPKCNLLKLIFNTIDSRETKLELSRNRIKPIKMAVNYIKISLFAMFFQLDKKYVVNELNNKDKLKKDYGFHGELNYLKLSEVFSRFDDIQILNFVINRLNKEFKKNKHGKRTILIDGTDIQFKINVNKKYYNKKKLEKKRV